MTVSVPTVDDEADVADPGPVPSPIPPIWRTV
jgi:hypothetical protein